MSWAGPWMQPKPTYQFADWGTPVPQRTLRELGLSAKYMLDLSNEAAQAWFEALSPADKEMYRDNYPLQYAVVNPFTVEKCYHCCLAYTENFESPSAMLFKLLNPDVPAKE